MNALAAATAAMAAGAGIDAVQRGLQSMRGVAGRLEVKQALQGARLIDDAYNANPGSMRVGLRALADIPGERWLVLGEMAELGEEGPRLHAEMGELARACGVTPHVRARRRRASRRWRRSAKAPTGLRTPMNWSRHCDRSCTPT